MKNSGSSILPTPKKFTQQDIDLSFASGQENQIDSSTGQDQAALSISKKRNIDNNKLKKLVKKSNRILLSIKTHRFPFDFSPDVVNIEEKRVNIVTKHFVASVVHSVDIKDVSNIFIESSLFFAKLVFISRTFEKNIISIDFLRKNEAIYARRIIEGLRVFELEKIDTSSYSVAQLLEKLKELSTTEIVI